MNTYIFKYNDIQCFILINITKFVSGVVNAFK